MRRQHSPVWAVLAIGALAAGGVRGVLAGGEGDACVNAGTTGVALRAPGSGTPSISIALVGTLTPVNAASAGYVEKAVQEINLLRPAAVFTLGNLVQGETRSEQRYGEEVESVRRSLDRLKMSWYPCVGRRDVLSGTRDAGDARFERLYQQKLGPLYYSVDFARPGVPAGGGSPLHVVVLDSEEVLPDGSRGISTEQRAWLRADLRRTFDRWSEETGATAPAVIVLLHRALWDMGGAEGRGGAEGGPGQGGAEMSPVWAGVHRLLVQFNERPIVSVEGDGPSGNGSGARSGPRVVAVYAGRGSAGAAYEKGATRDGIRYTELGPTAARSDQDASLTIRHFTLLQVNPKANDPVQAAIVKLVDADEGGAIVKDDVVTAPERQILDAIAALPNSAIGVEGALDGAKLGHAAAEGATGAGEGGEKSPLTLHVSNPLKVPLDVAIRLASARNLGTATAREDANPYTEGFDSPWQMDTLHQIRHLAPGADESWPITLEWSGSETNGGVPPPQVEFVVHWLDPRKAVGAGADGSAMKDILLKRRVPVVPYAIVPTLAHVGAGGDRAWLGAVQGEAYAWRVEPGELPQRNPEWQMAAEGKRLYLRVRVEDGTRSYSPDARLNWKWGGPASDAVALSWASEGKGEKAGKPGEARRLWILPFGPHGPELWENRGVGEKQTPLARAPGELGVKAGVENRPDGYTLNVEMPRSLIFDAGTAQPAEGDAEAGEASAVRFNLTVYDNDDGARTFSRSWAPEALGVAGWGHLRLKGAEQATTAPE